MNIIETSRSSAGIPKLSIIMAYHNRATQLRWTLASMVRHYSARRDELQLVIVDDTSPNKAELIELVRSFPFPHILFYADRHEVPECRNPGVLYNYAAEQAQAQLIMLTNPENFHIGPVATHAIDTYQPGTYRVYACRSFGRSIASVERTLMNVDEHTNWGEVPQGWYQHSVHFNRLLHFCSACDKATWAKIGGFDPDYDNGFAWEDTDLVQRIYRAQVVFDTVDDPFVAHQPHGRSHDAYRYQRNQALFQQKWAQGRTK